jgi:hypothetical protein
MASDFNYNVYPVSTSSNTVTITLPQINILGLRTYYIVDVGGNLISNNLYINVGDTTNDSIGGDTGIELGVNYSAVQLMSAPNILSPNVPGNVWMII